MFRGFTFLRLSAMAFASQPIPKGNRVGLITDTGGPAIIATDELVDNGLIIPELSENSKKTLKETLYPEAAINNPVDVLATAAAPHYRSALDVLMAEDQIDSVYINFVTPPFVDTESVAREMAEVSKHKIKPIVCNYMTDKPQWEGTTAILKDGGIPCYDYPEMAAKALAALTRYNGLRSRKIGDLRKFDDVNRTKVKDILSETKDRGRKILSASEVYEILSACGIPVAGWKMADNVANAQKAAEEIGFPVVVKADSETIVHKSDVGGVAIDLQDSNSVKTAAEKMEKKFGSEGLRFFVQKYMPEGREVIVGAKAETGLGHMIMFGLGGIHVELLKDVSFEITPVTAFEAKEMLTSIKSHQLLSGFRGEKGVDQKKLVEIIQRVAQLVSENPDIQEMDLNPIIAYEDSVYVVDARMSL